MKIINKKKQSGFTLIELLVVATIIIVLSAIGMISFANAGRSARNAKRQSDLETVRQALVLYKSDEGTYPTGNYTAIISTLSSGYISTPTPSDPKDGNNSCGVDGDVLCGYTYVGSPVNIPTSFILTAPLEGKIPFTVTNP
jgi:prepilin-type N-terminal cleavage/methylation domain-containing protein